MHSAGHCAPTVQDRGCWEGGPSNVTFDMQVGASAATPAVSACRFARARQRTVIAVMFSSKSPYEVGLICVEPFLLTRNGLGLRSVCVGHNLGLLKSDTFPKQCTRSQQSVCQQAQLAWPGLPVLGYPSHFRVLFSCCDRLCTILEVLWHTLEYVRTFANNQLSRIRDMQDAFGNIQGFELKAVSGQIGESWPVWPVWNISEKIR